MDLKINSLQHIGIPVTQLKKSIDFYEGLGFIYVMNSYLYFNIVGLDGERIEFN